MDYQPPFDPALGGVRQPNGTFNSDPNASYANGNAATASEGSIPPADAFENPQREIVAAIEAAGLTPNRTVLTQLRQANARQASGATYFASAGAANTYALTATPPAVGVLFEVPSSPFLGQLVRLVPHQTNTGAATATWAGVTKAIRTWNDQALAGGELVINRPTECWYDPQANGGAGALKIAPWAVAPTKLAADLGIPFNVTQVSFSTRTVLNGSGFLSFQTGTYTKKSATSRLIVETSTNIYTGGIGAECAISRLNIGGTNVEAIMSASDAARAVPAATVKRVLSGVGAGSLAWAWTCGRNDGTTWRSIVNPTSASDAAYLPAVTSSSLYISEIE